MEKYTNPAKRPSLTRASKISQTISKRGQRNLTFKGLSLKSHILGCNEQTMGDDKSTSIKKLTESNMPSITFKKSLISLVIPKLIISCAK